MTQNSDRPALSFSDSCKVLGVHEHVTEEDLKAAFHKKALLYPLRQAHLKEPEKTHKKA